MDTLEIINCPACGETMEKIFIPSEGINIDICTNGCGGIFFDNREFEKFNEIHEDISIIEEKLKNKNFKSVEDEGTRICPACGGQMVKNTSGIGGKIIVDDCYLCGGKFLDFGELIKIREEFNNDSGRSKAAMQFLYKEVGQDIKSIDQKLQQAKEYRSIAQKLFYSILDME